MNLTITTNYQPKLYFKGEPTKPEYKSGEQPKIETTTEGMTPDELMGRVQTRRNFFNMKTSYRYFAKGKDGKGGQFKDIPEYIEAGKTALENMSEYDKENQLNTLEYQEKLANMIVNNDALINNKGIRNSLFELVTEANNAPYTHRGDFSLRTYISEKTDARLQVLDTYAKSEEMQENDAINANISKLVLGVKNKEQSDLMVELLKNNATNDDKQYFELIGRLFRDNVDTKIIKKVQNVNQVIHMVPQGSTYVIGLEEQ